MNINHCLTLQPPENEAKLLEKCQRIAGLNFAQLAAYLHVQIPSEPNRRKGFIGLAIEIALGTTAGSRPIPDFHHLGIELKTIPLNAGGKPKESTFITSIPLLTIHHEQWGSSQCRKKLQKVLWLPVEGDNSIPFEQRRIGSAMLWSPNADEERVLANDWQELTAMVGQGHLESITAHVGEYLQIRPKAMNARSLCYGFDAEGNKVLTLPRGFYLRSRFTSTLFSSNNQL